MTAESIQLLHTGCGHWVAISTIGYKLAEVNVYDSMRPALTDNLNRQISAILCLPIQKRKECILKYEQLHCYLLLILLTYIKYCYCQSQTGSLANCGLFAFAFISILAKGDDHSLYL